VSHYGVAIYIKKYLKAIYSKIIFEYLKYENSNKKNI
jgi:hypothetical protein